MTIATASKKNILLSRLEEAEGTRLKRDFSGCWNAAYSVLAAVYSLVLLYSAVDASVSSAVFRGGFLMAITSMIFLRHPARVSSPQNRPSWADLALVALSVVAFGNFIVDYENMAWRAGAVTGRDIFFGVIAIALVLEGCRRAMSLMLPLIALAMTLYAYLGVYIPGELFGHQGFEIGQVIGEIYASMNGIFGFVTYVFIAYVMLFIVMGAMFETFGAGAFFIGLPVALMARSRGGAAKAAVVSSALFGTISGSATANVVATGTFTIPLMKRTGYQPHVAAGIESAASTGGMFMPPVMGAGAFLMAEMMQVSYAEVVKVAAIPALLYFAAILVMVHFEALSTGIKPIPEHERQRPRDVLREGWFFLIPLAVLFGALFTGRTASFAAFAAIMSFLAVMFVRMSLQRRFAEFFKLLFKALVEGGEKSLMVGSTAGPVGIIVCMVLLTGLGFKFSALLLGFTYGQLWLAMILVMIGTIVLGLGMTVTADYLILAVLAVPALGELGIPLMAAHMAVFWLSQSSNVTPPVCMAAFAGAGIAGSSPYSAGFQAMRFSAYLYVMPFMFVYTPVLMPDGFNMDVLHTWIGLLMALVPFGAAVSGHLFERLSPAERIVLFISAVGLSLPEWRATALGLVLFAVVAVLNVQKRRSRSEALLPDADATRERS
jgi:TRAP transporter 4TM/12TM fusion protein